MKGSQRERVIDGRGYETVFQVTPGSMQPECAPGAHCAAHGEGPFFCCRCGAEFRLPTETEWKNFYATGVPPAGLRGL